MATRCEYLDGNIDVGIPYGTPALLDCSSGLGKVRSELQGGSEPEPDAPYVEVHGETGGQRVDPATLKRHEPPPQPHLDHLHGGIPLFLVHLLGRGRFILS